MKLGASIAIVGLLLGVIPASSQDVSGNVTEPAAAPKKTVRRAVAKPAIPAAALNASDALAAGKSLDAEFGWNVVTDPATGIRVGLPTKMVPVAHDAMNGTRWSSRHGDVQVETFRIKTTDNLKTLFDQQKREPANRKTEYSLMKDDNFFISGLQGLKKFSVRAQLRDGELRGFTMLFDQAVEGIVAPVMVAMSSAFAPFPGNSTPIAALAKPVEYATGLIVSADGYIVTDSRVAEDCQVIVASGVGSAERVASDAERGLALLRVYGRANLALVALASGAGPSGELRLIGIPDPHLQGGDRKAAEVKAKLDGAAIELRQSAPVAGFSGAAALDGENRVVGMMQARNAVIASAGPATPPVRLVSAATIRDFLAAHHVAAAAAGGDPNAAVVRIICVRK